MPHTPFPICQQGLALQAALANAAISAMLRSGQLLDATCQVLIAHILPIPALTPPVPGVTLMRIYLD
jgi:hypothetical protein